ncbi:MAG: hypothetical protein R2790_06035 [Flavobacterium haoranii]
MREISYAPMKIAKYLFLLLLLICVAAFVFIATQPNDFAFSKSYTISNNKDQVYDYVADVKSWPNWFLGFKESQTSFKADSTSVFWESSPLNKISKSNVHAKDSIDFEITYEDFDATSQIKFLNQKKEQTEIVWKFEGKLNFKAKLLAFLNGGAENMYGSQIEKSLQNIKENLTSTFNQHTITINSFVTKHETNYISIKDSITSAKVETTILSNINKLKSFIKDNALHTKAEPFTIFHQITKDKAVIETCFPIEEEVVTSSETSITSGKLNEYFALKATLKGNWTYKDKLWAEAKKSVEKSSYKEKSSIPYLEVYKNIDTKTPANSVTELYIAVSKPVVEQEENDSLKTATDSIQ